MIEYFEINGLPRQPALISAHLHDDINIITGRNGSGKTTILKLLWYVTSGNIEHAIHEVPFSRVYVKTDKFAITVLKQSGGNKIELIQEGSKAIFEDTFDDDTGIMQDAEEEANNATRSLSNSVFFPTFRRIEGGFTIDAITGPPSFRSPKGKSAIEEALQALSRRLTVDKNVFVSAISTYDIVNLLMRNYTEMSEIANALQEETSQEVIRIIKNHKQDSNMLDPREDNREGSVLDTIRSMIESMEEQRAAALAPLDAVRNVVEAIFHHAGIKLNSRLSFGDAANAVNSDMLSAGEKQMLSFICYNAFSDNSIIFIDEPELSLHVDWQRQLFPTLQGQGKKNQFIVATHSPFIYGKYPDKEILISSDRGASSLEID